VHDAFQSTGPASCRRTAPPYGVVASCWKVCVSVFGGSRACLRVGFLLSRHPAAPRAQTRQMQRCYAQSLPDLTFGAHRWACAAAAEADQDAATEEPAAPPPSPPAPPPPAPEAPAPPSSRPRKAKPMASKGKKEVR
jgi:hypothetical protein